MSRQPSWLSPQSWSARAIATVATATTFGGLVITAHASHASATTTTFAAAADTYVNSSQPSANYGTTKTIRDDGSPDTRGYVRFSVTGLSAAPSAATLRLYAKSNNSASTAVQTVASSNWSETGMTWSNAPALGGQVGATGAVTTGSWVAVDVSSVVTGNGTYSFALTDPSVTATAFASREAGSSTAPQLVVTTGSTGPVTNPSPSPSPTNTLPPKPSPSPTPTPTATATSGDWQPSFPINAAFYYPWFPEAWNQQGYNPFTNYHPSLGYYDSSSTSVIASHIRSMQYAGMNAGISSWWGQGTPTDKRVPLLLQGAAGSHFRWSLYYEKESLGDPSVSELQSDLNYIKNNYGSNPSFLRVNGKPVIFVYAADNDACGMADRWNQANTMGFYVVLKVFPGYLNCASQPASWHQYSPAVDYDAQGPYSVAIAPGFWKKGTSVRLARDTTRWSSDVAKFKASSARFRLVTTFNEWGEGTSVESAQEWATSSGDGFYLDALHNSLGSAG